MNHILTTCREAAIAALPLVLLYILLDRLFFREPRRSAVYLVFSIYLAAMYAAAGLPDVLYVRFDPNFNFRPFQYMFSAWQTTALNVMLFVPLGGLLPVLWKEYQSLPRTLCFGFALTFSIEFLQIFTYRATDVNDLITNTLGTLAGYLAGTALLRRIPAIQPRDRGKDIHIVFASAGLVMYFVYPFLARMIL